MEPGHLLSVNSSVRCGDVPSSRATTRRNDEAEARVERSDRAEREIDETDGGQVGHGLEDLNGRELHHAHDPTPSAGTWHGGRSRLPLRPALRFPRKTRGTTLRAATACTSPSHECSLIVAQSIGLARVNKFA